METRITGFHRDAEAHWVAELACGHTQHVRHKPPWQNRAWVATEEGRTARIGAAIDCPLCDMPALPADAREYRRTQTFTEETLPRALRADHATKPGVWARIVVTKGKAQYAFGQPRRVHVLSEDRVGIVEPQVRHCVVPLGPVALHVEFWRRPRSEGEA